jgi:hypothetical protein
MSETRVILCGEAASDGIGLSSGVLRLRNANPDQNVQLHIDDISQSLVADVPPQFLDLERFSGCRRAFNIFLL